MNSICSFVTKFLLRTRSFVVLYGVEFASSKVSSKISSTFITDTKAHTHVTISRLNKYFSTYTSHFFQKKNVYKLNVFILFNRRDHAITLALGIWHFNVTYFRAFIPIQSIAIIHISSLLKINNMRIARSYILAL